MTTRFSRILSVSLFVVLTASAAWGQNAPKEFYFFEKTNPYLSFGNAAAMTLLPEGKISIADLSFNKEDGGCIGVKDSDNSWNAGANTESYIKLSDKISFHGLLAYDYFNGNNMGGPILLDPSYNFINFYEKLETTTGTKAKETYHITGDMSYSFSEKWSLGLGFNYEVIDRSKHKDPRTLNTWMDMDVTAGAFFKCSESLSLGLSLQYRSTLERLKTNIYGTTDQTYYTLVDYGACFGNVEMLAGDEGYLSVSNARPMRNSFYGGSIQLIAGKKTKLYNEISFLKRGGSFGSPGETNVIFCEASGYDVSYKGTLMIPRGSNLHTVGLSAVFESLSNNENVYKKSYEQGKSLVVNYYGQNNVLTQTSASAVLSYSYAAGVENTRPKTETGISISGDYLTQRASLYPFYRDHNVITADADAFFLKNLFAGKSIFTIQADALFHMGFGTPKSDGKFASTTSSAPYSADVYLNRQFEYDTAMRAGAGLSFKYTRLFSEKFAVFVSLSDRFNMLLKEPQHLLGRTRNAAVIAVGCNF